MLNQKTVTLKPKPPPPSQSPSSQLPPLTSPPSPREPTAFFTIKQHRKRCHDTTLTINVKNRCRKSCVQGCGGGERGDGDDKDAVAH